MVSINKSVGNDIFLKSDICSDIIGLSQRLTGDNFMKNKISTLFDYIKTLSKSDLDRIMKLVLSIVSVNQHSQTLPHCPYCGGTRVIKYGHKNKKQRFMCHDCKRTHMHTTNSLMANSHYTQSIWIDFIQDTLYGKTLDDSAEKYGFSPQTAFNMRHKVLMALQDLLEKNSVLPPEIAESDETFVHNCYKGGPVPEPAGYITRKYGGEVTKCVFSNKYILIHTGTQHDGGMAIVRADGAELSDKKFDEVFHDHIVESALVLTDGLYTYRVPVRMAVFTAADINWEKSCGIFNLNTLNSLYSLIKGTYNH